MIYVTISETYVATINIFNVETDKQLEILFLKTTIARIRNLAQ